MHTKNITGNFYFRRKGLFIFGKNSSNGTKDSTYAEIENKRSGDTTYQELSVIRNQKLTISESGKAYENLELV